jgi:hypothetical protein
MKRLPVVLLSIIVTALPAQTFAQAGQATGTSPIVGGWTLNKNSSDAPPEPSRGDSPVRRGGGLGRGRSGGGGGFPGGGSGGRGRGGNSEDTRRRTEAVRTIMDAPERLTITRTDSLVIIVDGDGRTTRLSPDGKKIKDDATGITRTTKWDGDTLVSEITGAGAGTITESYSVEPADGRLNVTLQMESARGSGARLIHRAYDRIHEQ